MTECLYAFNRYRKQSPDWKDEYISSFGGDQIGGFHTQLPGYRPTPLFSLPSLARVLGLGKILVKDESYRFDLNAFKIMGASYAVYRFLKNEWESIEQSPFQIRTIMENSPDDPWAGRYTFCTATDGNHGRAVAWIARRLHQKAVIYMPRGSVAARIDNIRAEGAEVRVIDGTYDDTVKKIAGDAEKNGWQIISDTAYPGYMTIPGWIEAGYTTMFREMESSIHSGDDPGIDLVFLQGGVGSFAAAGIWYYVNRYGESRPKLVSVEPVQAACLMESIKTPGGHPVTSKGSFNTIMAGLNCGTPSLIAWPVIKEGMDLFLAITDDYAEKAMRQYYFPYGDDPHIMSGESGAAGLAALIALMKDKNLRRAREKLGLNNRARVLLFNTEGATDPVNFGKIVYPRR